MKKLKLLVDWKDKKVGDYINVNEEAAKMCIKEGYAEEISNVLSSPSPECCFSGKALSEPKPEPSGSGKAFPDMPNFKEVTGKDITGQPVFLKVVINRNVAFESCHILQKNEIVEPPYDIAYMSVKEYDEYRKKVKNKDKEEENKIKKTAISGLKIDNYLDNAKILYTLCPYFYDNSNMWWVWDKDKWAITNDVDMERMLDSKLGFMGQSVNSSIRNNHLRAMMWVGREKKPKEAPLKWIQFNSKAVSLKSGNVYEVTKEYFFTNPIPYELGETEDTPTIDKLFEDWVGKENVVLLYEILAYCLYRDYPIHRVFFLIGSGSNGKTTFLQLIERFLGKTNICSTELDNLVGNNSSRFETMKMYKKLACLMGETNFTSMNKTTMLKKLSGKDLIGFEMKGKQPFDEYNYSKLIIASNSLPVTNDTTEGLWRRCIVIDFPNKFKEQKNIIDTIPLREYSNLARKCINILKNLIQSCSFTNEGTIEDRKQKYIMASNPLPIFIKTFCQQGNHLYMRYGEFFLEYQQFLKINKKRLISKKEFSKFLSEEGVEVRKTSKEGEIDYYVEGIKFFPDFPDFSKIPLSQFNIGGNREIVEIEEIKEKTKEKSKVNILLDYLKLHKAQPVSENELKQFFEKEADLYENLEILAKKGEIFCIKPYFWQYLD